jgi:hypothetical protein
MNFCGRCAAALTLFPSCLGLPQSTAQQCAKAKNSRQNCGRSNPRELSFRPRALIPKIKGKYRNFPPQKVPLAWKSSVQRLFASSAKSVDGDGLSCRMSPPRDETALVSLKVKSVVHHLAALLISVSRYPLNVETACQSEASAGRIGTGMIDRFYG